MSRIGTLRHTVDNKIRIQNGTGLRSLCRQTAAPDIDSYSSQTMFTFFSGLENWHRRVGSGLKYGLSLTPPGTYYIGV